MSEQVMSIYKRECTVPLDKVALPEGYVHYPNNEYDMAELYEGLIESADLDNLNAARVLGYAATGAWANCDNYWTITGMIQRAGIEAWGRDNLRGDILAAYEAGIEDADKEWRQ